MLLLAFGKALFDNVPPIVCSKFALRTQSYVFCDGHHIGDDVLSVMIRNVDGRTQTS